MYENLFKKLIKAEVAFLILGGGAVSLHGFSRMTTDIDILLKNDRDNIIRFVAATGLWGAGCAVGLTFEDFQGPGCVRIVEEFPLDVFTVLNGRSYENFIDSATSYSLKGDLKVKCLSIADLIELKKGTLREKDQLDVIALRRLANSPPRNEPPSINLEAPNSTAQ